MTNGFEMEANNYLIALYITTQFAKYKLKQIIITSAFNEKEDHFSCVFKAKYSSMIQKKPTRPEIKILLPKLVSCILKKNIPL